MQLLPPLAIFLVLCIMLLVLLAQTKPPTASDTVEALCDALLRRDVKTQRTLMTTDSVSTPVMHALGQMLEDHEETARTYFPKVVKEWDDANASYEIVQVPLNDPKESVQFTCRWVVNQWTIIGIKIESPQSQSPSQ